MSSFSFIKTNTTNSNTNYEEKINTLMEKINNLEKSLLEEREKRVKYEKELNDIKNFTLPKLEKTLEEKESLCRTSFIERVRIEKEFKEKIKEKDLNNINNNNKTNNNNNNNNNLNLIPLYDTLKNENEKKNLLVSKLEYINNLYKDLRKKYNDLSLEKLNAEKEFKEKFFIEEEKSEIIKRQIKDMENIISSKNLNIKSLTESNKNLLSEIKVLSVSNQDFKKINEIRYTDNEFSKKELEK
jgi:hypothetical protein